MYFAGLNLTRYVSEATQALAEAKLKLSDLNTALHICSLFHRRYSDFSLAMLDSWKRVLPLQLQKGEPIVNTSKLRVDLKFLPEQILMGLVPVKPALAVLSTLLQVLVDSEKDKEERVILPLINTFAKHFAFDFLGMIHQAF